MGTDDLQIAERLRLRSEQADKMIAALRKQVVELKAVALARAFSDEISKLKTANDSMVAEVDQLKSRLIKAEIRKGVKQFPIPGATSNGVAETTNATAPQATVVSENKAAAIDVPTKIAQPRAAKKKEGGAPKAAEAGAAAKAKEEEPEPDVSRLDFRVGLIRSAKKHPDADALYVEDVDLGGGDNRTVVSGLVRFVPLDEMQNRLVVLLCNLKAAKMRGVTSQAMVMCASTPEKVEILIPPTGSAPGDRVVVDEFPGEPDKELNPKKKIFERVAPDLKTDARLVATYKGAPLRVPGKGVVVAPSLANVQIK